MDKIQWERYSRVAQHPLAHSWLQIQANLGLAQNTIDAYGRALEDYLSFCHSHHISAEAITKEAVSLYVHDLTSRSNPRGGKIRPLDSGVGLANATLQQRLVAVRLFHDYLVEEGIRVDNPVGRGRYTPGKSFGGMRNKGLIPRYHKLPWIPDEDQWQAVLQAAKEEPLRNRLMLAMAYDAALRREELCALASGDIDPAHRILRIHSETTKNMWERTFHTQKKPGPSTSHTCRNVGP
jgi:integrase/recombinase XerD